MDSSSSSRAFFYFSIKTEFVVKKNDFLYSRHFNLLFLRKMLQLTTDYKQGESNVNFR